MILLKVWVCYNCFCWSNGVVHPAKTLLDAGFSDILIYLAASFPKRRGGGDFDEHPTIGRWAGHRIALLGDGGPR